MDAFLEMSLEQIVIHLSLSDWIEKALLEREGSMGLILDTAINFEIAEFGKVNFDKMNQFGASQSEIQRAYEKSILSTAEVMDSLT